MNQERRARADELRELIGTSDRNHRYQVVVTGTRRHTGNTVPLATFEWDEAGRIWNIDVQPLFDKLDDGGQRAVDDVVSAIRSSRHGRLTSDGTVWNFGKAKVSVLTMNVVLNALREASRHSVVFDRILAVQSSKMGPRIKKLRELKPEARQHAEQLLYTEILKAL